MLLTVCDSSRQAAGLSLRRQRCNVTPDITPEFTQPACGKPEEVATRHDLNMLCYRD